VNINYPTWKVKSSPTPTDKLIICDACGYAEWTIHSNGYPTAYCPHDYFHADKKPKRMREATRIEYELGKAALKKIIG
jgi:hypothetical protein